MFSPSKVAQSSIQTTKNLCRYAATLQHHAKRSQLLPRYRSPSRNMSSSLQHTDGRILGRSTIMLQDGIDILELPVIIRRLDQTLVPVTMNMLSLDDIQKISEQDAIFKTKLQACITVKEVFRLLEIPSDQVTAYAAAFTLQRICQLQMARNDMDQIDSFIRGAVMKELCDTTAKGVKTLTNDTVINLVNCYMRTDKHPASFARSVDEEVEKRIGDGKFSIKELCSITRHLTMAEKGDRHIVDSIYIHIGSRSCELDESNIVGVYSALATYPQSSSCKCVLSTIEKSLERCWWKLSSGDCAKVLTAVVRTNYRSIPLLRWMGKLLFLNIHDFKNDDLMHVVASYISFRFTDTRVLKALERFTTAKITKMDANLLALVMEYCRTSRILSPRILDAAAAHIEEHGHTYDVDHLYSILRPFGHLNYLPRSAGPLLLEIEKLLWEKYDDLPSEKLLELLASFAYLERFPINFVKKVFTPYVFSAINNIQDSHRRCQAQHHLMLLQSAIKLEWKDCYVPFLFAGNLPKVWIDDRRHRFSKEIKGYLVEMVGSENLKEMVPLEKSPFYIDMVINTDRGCPQDQLSSSGLAVVLTMPEHCCVNTSTLLGEYSMRLRHIKLLGYVPVQIYMDEYSVIPREERRKYIEEQLAHHVSKC